MLCCLCERATMSELSLSFGFKNSRVLLVDVVVTNNLHTKSVVVNIQQYMVV